LPLISKHPVKLLEEVGYKDTHRLVPGASGVAPEDAYEFCKANGVRLAVFTTSNATAEYIVKGPRNALEPTICMLAHHKHAYLVLESKYKDCFGHTTRPFDCHCGQCNVPVTGGPEKHEHSKCEDCFMLRVGETTERTKET
jgi:hypothetical protein